MFFCVVYHINCVLLWLQKWDEIQIEEETEEGEKVKSTIQVPMQVSPS